MRIANINMTTNMTSGVTRPAGPVRPAKPAVQIAPTAFRGGMPMQIVSGVRRGWVNEAIEHIDNFPSKWLERFYKENFDILFTPNIKVALILKNLPKPPGEQSLDGVLGCTYVDDLVKTFIFVDKPPYSDVLIRGTVNHEFGHGIVAIEQLKFKSENLDALIKDIDEMSNYKKLGKLTPRERGTVESFFGSEGRCDVDEIMADIIAWQKGGEGNYGNPNTFVDNPKFMQYLFPNLWLKLQNV